MRKNLFLYTLVPGLLVTQACASSNFRVQVPGLSREAAERAGVEVDENGVPWCPTGKMEDADVITFAGNSPGVMYKGWVFQESHSVQDLITLKGRERYLLVRPLCTFQVGMAYGRPPRTKWRGVAGFQYRNRYTVLIDAYNPTLGSLRPPTVSTFTYRPNPVGEWFQFTNAVGQRESKLVNEVLRLPSARVREAGSRFRIQIDPAALLLGGSK